MHLLHLVLGCRVSLKTPVKIFFVANLALLKTLYCPAMIITLDVVFAPERDHLLLEIIDHLFTERLAYI